MIVVNQAVLLKRTCNLAEAKKTGDPEKIMIAQQAFENVSKLLPHAHHLVVPQTSFTN